MCRARTSRSSQARRHRRTHRGIERRSHDSALLTDRARAARAARATLGACARVCLVAAHPWLCGIAQLGGGERVAELAQGAAERPLGGGRHDDVTLAREQAQASRARVIGDERRERGVPALDQARRAAVLEPAGALLEIGEQPHDRLRQRGGAPRGEERPPQSS